MHEDQAGLEPWMMEVVSGHPTILWDGQRRGMFMREGRGYWKIA